MMKNRRKDLMILILLCLLILVVTGCEEKKINEIKNEIKEARMAFIEHATNSNKLKPETYDRIKEILGFDFIDTVAVDSVDGNRKVLINPEAEELSDPVTAILNLTSFSVVRISDIEVGSEKYSSCNYINANGKISLVCHRGENPSKSDRDKFPAELAREIEKESGIENIGFLVVINDKNKETKLISSEDYEAFQVEVLPHKISKVERVTSWTVLTNQVNPCCHDIYYDDGSWRRWCDRSGASC